MYNDIEVNCSGEFIPIYIGLGPWDESSQCCLESYPRNPVDHGTIRMTRSAPVERDGKSIGPIENGGDEDNPWLVKIAIWSPWALTLFGIPAPSREDHLTSNYWQHPVTLTKYCGVTDAMIGNTSSRIWERKILSGYQAMCEL